MRYSPAVLQWMLNEGMFDEPDVVELTEKVKQLQAMIKRVKIIMHGPMPAKLRVQFKDRLDKLKAKLTEVAERLNDEEKKLMYQVDSGF